MTHPRRILLLVACSVLTLGSGTAATDQDDHEIHRCRDENGLVTFQNDPCPELPRQKAPPPGPAAPNNPKKRKTQGAPGPNEAMKAGTIELRVGNGSWTISLRPQDQTPVRARRSFGRQTFPTRHEAGGTMASPSFAYPEQTWRTLLAALEGGDRAVVVACLTPEAVESLGSLDDLRRMVRSFDRIEDDGDLGPFWAIHGVREGRPPKWILFEEVATGEWKISGI